jgi:serine/threonine-protein kinase
MGLSSEEAQTMLVEANFTPIVEKVSSSKQKNTVIAQAPGGGTTLELGSAVALQVSNGKGEPVLVPRVVGLGKVAAVLALEEAGLVAALKWVEVEDEDLVGRVVSQVPIGNKELDVGSTVTIYVGIPPEGVA